MPNADVDAIVARWLGGQNANGISRSLKVPPGRVREAIGRYAATAIPLDRQVSVARQLGRLDLMLETVLPLARSGNFKAITAACKLIGQQNLILGINQPTTAVVQIDAPARPTMTARLQAAIENLVAEQGPPDGSPPN
jgi:hypothetical protein